MLLKRTCFFHNMLAVDRREADLSRALADIPHELRELPVGDILCEYGEREGAWIGERKRASDLAASLADCASSSKLRASTRPVIAASSGSSKAIFVVTRCPTSVCSGRA